MSDLNLVKIGVKCNRSPGERVEVNCKEEDERCPPAGVEGASASVLSFNLNSSIFLTHNFLFTHMKKDDALRDDA